MEGISDVKAYGGIWHSQTIKEVVKSTALRSRFVSLGIEHLCPQIVWADIRGLGNRLRHDYANINLIRIWLIVEKELAPLKAAVNQALQSLHDQD